MDHQLRPLRCSARIRRAVVEAVILLRIRHDNETIVHERPIHQFLNPGRREHHLLLRSERLIVEDDHGANVGAFAIITARRTCRLPTDTADCPAPSHLRFVERHPQPIDPDYPVVAG